jgi:hypothetical protein
MRGEEEEVKERNRRRIKIIDRTLQYRIVATYLGVVLAGFVIFSAGFFLYYWISYSYGDNLFKEIITIHKQVTETKSVEENGVMKVIPYTTTRDIPGVNRIELILPPLLINNLVTMMFVILIGIVTSHRIAGPAFRMQQEIARVIAGEKGVRVRLRKKDSFHERIEQLGGGKA